MSPVGELRPKTLISLASELTRLSLVVAFRQPAGDMDLVSTCCAVFGRLYQTEDDNCGAS
jgi:hypothetical protein